MHLLKKITIVSNLGTSCNLDNSFLIFILIASFLLLFFFLFFLFLCLCGSFVRTSGNRSTVRWIRDFM